MMKYVAPSFEFSTLLRKMLRVDLQGPSEVLWMSRNRCSNPAHESARRYESQKIAHRSKASSSRFSRLFTVEFGEASRINNAC